MKAILTIFSIALIIFSTNMLSAQTGILKGKVTNGINNETIPYATVALDSNKVVVLSDIDGNFRFENLEPGTYTLQASFIGYKKAIYFEVMVAPNKATTFNIEMEENIEELEEVTVSSARFTKNIEAPVSLRTINAAEIYRSPGGNRDISKVIQTLPGVASTLSFRNDIIVRGGAPNENRFFLDGIEVPNINHFATQGSSGGPVGMINVNFIRQVDFYAGAFPANRGNAMSSIMDFRQISGNDEKLTGNIMLGSSDIGLTLDGPAGKKSTFIFSARRSYLQFLFKALALPFLPTYNDFQYKHQFDFNSKNRLTIVGLAAIDDFELNQSANDGLEDTLDLQRNNYILGNLPVNTQWNYTLGANWTHFGENSKQNIVISRNHLNNNSIKYQNNIEEEEFLNLDYNSQEIETKVRIENTSRPDVWKINYGAGFQNVLYTNSTFNKREYGGKIVEFDFDSELVFNKYEAFAQASRPFFDQKLTASFGIRTDFNDYSKDMAKPLKQLSPRLSLSYAATPNINVNANIGRYYQLPAYTILGYRNNNGELENKNNNVTYINTDHYVIGAEYLPNNFSKISVEGFYKDYDKYPFLLSDSISMANLGGDFGVIGNEPVESKSKGRSYGVELLMQQKLSSSIYGILSYTWVRSEFEDKNGEYIPSAWDNRHVLNITAGKKFKRNWEVGMKFRYLGGTPFTPYNEELSANKAVWDITQRGIYDWDRLNEKRNPSAHGMDIRVDKKWNLKKLSVNVYLDIQNIYNFQAEGQPFLDVVRNEAGKPITSPTNPMAYQLREIDNTNGTLLPSIGVMVNF